MWVLFTAMEDRLMFVSSINQKEDTISTESPIQMLPMEFSSQVHIS